MNDRPPGGRRRAAAKRAGFALALAALAIGLPLALAETAYRFQWVDTYRAELRAYNAPDVLSGAETKPTLLGLGDSFTAGAGSYPVRLRDLLPGWRIVNGGIPGTGIVQANIVAPRRLRDFHPQICVYQLYVGNDLFDIRYPAGGRNLTIGRRLYWFLACRLRVLAYINYRLGQWRAAGRPEGQTTETRRHGGAESLAAPCLRASPWVRRTSGSEDVPDSPAEPFDPSRYDPRERLYLAAEPTLLEDQVRVTPRRAADYAQLLRGVAELRARCRRAGATLILLPVPHAAQVSPLYRKRMRRLGAIFTAPQRMGDADYPFLVGLRRAFADDPGVRIVDPLPALQAAERDGVRVYLTHDGHLNAAGQACVARVLAAALH